MARLIAITGGIGSGKSMVSRMLRIMGYRVYDCDFMAKTVTNNNPEAVKSIVEIFGSKAFDEISGIDWRYLASMVFKQKDLILRLNEIIHPLVRKDVAKWSERYASEDFLFVETAILRECGMESMFDNVWVVTAPESLRIERVMKRNALTANAVRERIAAQKEYSGINSDTIVNDGAEALLPRILSLLKCYKGILNL